MNKKAFIISGIVLFSFTLAAQVTVDHLLCENLTDPLGIDSREPRFSWQLQADKRNTMQVAYEIMVTSGKATVWKTGKVMSDRSVHIPYEGASLSSGKLYQWKVRVWENSGRVSSWSAPARFQTALFDASDWKAKWIEAGFPEDPVSRPAQYFRKGFTLKKKIASATAYITAHGLYEARINGKRVGDRYLTPGWTSYNKRLEYQVYDVTSLLQRGNNAIGVVVGNGWYRGFIAWNGNKNSYGSTLGILVQMDILYTDGSKESVLSDGSWKSSDGSITYAEIYHGESIDARREKKGWAAAEYNDQNWKGVAVKEYSFANLLATFNEPVRKHETFKPVRIFTTPKGEKVIDFGQNLVGWVIVKAKGKAGDSISIRHAEVLDKEGNFYLDNIRSAKATANYYLRGEGEEVFEPHFTFYGFRYIRLDAWPGDLQPENFEAVSLYSDMQPTGRFKCSDSLINQLQHNIQWGQRGNFLDVPTDCPQRDERLGWTGDAQVFSRTAAFNFRVNNFFSKWMKDVAADQRSDGSVPFVIPNVLGVNSAGSTGWADVATIIPWNMYSIYGDKRILEDQYPSMKAWVTFMENNSNGYLWNKGFHFGDWLFYRPFDDNDGRSAVTDKYFIAQCFFAHSTQLLINAAEVIGKKEEAAQYRQLLQHIKEAFMKEYVTPSGRLVSGTQTALVLALQFDMLPENLRRTSAEKLVQNIKDYGTHLTTGFLGTPYLCHVLTRFGYTDMAYQLLMQKTYPSWLYPVTMGATTIWERWNGIHPDGNFEPASMNSFNHYAYGAIGDWMYRVITGINPDEDNPGYKHIILQPHVHDTLQYASASLETYYGTISSAWKKQEGKLVFEFSIPPNTNATVFLPAASPSQVKENGAPVSGTDDGKSVRLNLGSGNYRFEVSGK